jgi:hypothetical protein
VTALSAGAADAGSAATTRCATLVGSPWTAATPDGVIRGHRYRVTSERLPCFVATRLAAQLIPLRTRKALAAARPPGYLCLALGTSANPYRPATAIGTCLQKPLTTQPPRSFSWRPLAAS